ncbi:MAG TPA: hypothetical protein VGJ26_11145 [Pirellulales bacterium]|jgi:hypothetical protein
MLAVFHRRVWARIALAGFILLAVATTAQVAYHVHWAHKRREFLAREQAAWEAKGATRRYIISEDESRTALFLRLVGERGYDSVFIAVDVATKEELTDSEISRMVEAGRLFPEASISVIYIDNEVDGGIRVLITVNSLSETSEVTAILHDLLSGNWW